MILRNKGRLMERGAQGVFLLCASISVLAVALISGFILYRGMPAMFTIGIPQFLFGSEWQPTAGIFGIAPMIVASLLVSLLSVVTGSAVGLMTAVFLAEIAPKWLAAALRPAVDLLAGIPSVVYGLFGIMVIVPAIRNASGGVIAGNSLLAAAVVLAVMILPTMISICEDALRTVPREYREGSLAMGASHIQTIFKVTIPAAKNGIFAGIVLGAGRAIGEATAVLMVSGNRARMPAGIALGDPSTWFDWLLSPVRTLTGNVAQEMGYSSGLHQDALFATGVVLFVFIMLLNLALRMVARSGREA